MDITPYISEGTLHVMLGWACIGLGLALFAALLRIDDRRKSRRLARLAELAAPAEPEIDRSKIYESHWREIAEIAEERVAGAEAIAAIQAAAGVQIDAAEHAYKRLMDEFCVGLGASAVADPRPAADAVRRPLAA